MAAYVKTIEDPNRTSLQWVIRALETIEQPSYGRAMRLGHLFQTESENSRNDRVMGERRRAIHNDLCRILLHIPQLSVQGFARLAAEAEARQAIAEFLDTVRRRAVPVDQGT